MNGFRDIFPTLILEFDLSGHPCETSLKNIIQHTETHDHALLPAGGTSNFGGNILKNPMLSELKTTIDIAVGKYVEASGLMPVVLHNSWFNIMKRGSFTKPHRHEKSVVSGAYYIEAEPNSVGLTLVNPTKIYKMNELYDNITNYSTNDCTIDAYAGKLIIFPSWLEHYTDINESEKRVVVSFNYA